jgi:tRNA U34 5-carboxymethylaminomethyl modifying enzyme MnmG/GidA
VRFPDPVIHSMTLKSTDKDTLLRIIGLSYEERVMLNEVRPESVGQARRVEGVGGPLWSLGCLDG